MNVNMKVIIFPRASSTWPLSWRWKYMLSWVGNDQPMKMRETSRDWDKKLNVNNNLLGKSWILAVYMVCVAILYPGIKITISTETKEQSRRLVREKILNDLYHNCPNLRREISERNIKVGSNESYCKFHNGSVITV